jgi:hypothetical protein
MNDFFFNVFNIIGGLLFGLFCTFFSIKKHRRLSWFFLFPSIICFGIAIAVSFFDKSKPSAKEELSLKNVAVTKNDSLQASKTKIPKMKPLTNKVSFSPEQIPSDNPDYPYAIQAILHTDKDINRPHIFIYCDSPINNGDFGFITLGVILNKKCHWEPNYFELSCSYPPFTAHDPIQVTLYAKQPFKILRVNYKP